MKKLNSSHTGKGHLRNPVF